MIVLPWRDNLDGKKRKFNNLVLMAVCIFLPLEIEISKTKSKFLNYVLLADGLSSRGII